MSLFHMLFAYSPCSEALRKSLQKQHAEDAKAGKQWLVLLDGSMLDATRLHALEHQLGTNASQVLEGTALESFGPQGPLIMSLPLTSAAALDAVARLCSATPALSFVVPRQDAEGVKQALRWLALAMTDDGMPLHCRFSDTRVTPSLLDVLAPEQNAALSAAIDSWYWPSRQGCDLEHRTFTPADFDSTERSLLDQPLALDDTQFAKMLQAAEADMVYQMLVEKTPELKPTQPAGEMHTRIEHMLAAAHGHGLQGLPDLFEFVVLGLSTDDAFDLHPALAPIWSNHDPKTQRFADWVQQWPLTIWQALGTGKPQPIGDYP